MSEELQKKVDAAIKLIRSVAGDDVIEVSYSGGKDSDIILELAKMSGVRYRAIYKNTTIDPPGTILHAKEMGAAIIPPRKKFFKLIEESGYPSLFVRHCCRSLKEYKCLDKAIIGIRRSESYKRAKRYQEPVECRFYRTKYDRVEVVYPILYWTDEDVVEFIQERGLKIHKLYYREDGTIDPKRRLGCLCCPLSGHRRRIEEFKKYPNMVKAYIKAGQRYLDTHPDSRRRELYDDVYEWFYREVFCYKQSEFDEIKNGLFKPDFKALLEKEFNVKLK